MTNDRRAAVWRVTKVVLYFIIPALLGYLLGLALPEETSLSKESLYWFFGASVQAFSALLGLVGIVIIFRIQHIRDQLRDIQSAIIDYSRHSLMWIFAGFDLDEIRRRKDHLFERLKGRQPADGLEAVPYEKGRFDQLLEGYVTLDTERTEMYNKVICPMLLLVGIIVLSFIGLAFVDEIYLHGFPALLSFAGIIIWATIVIGRFLISMTLRERKIRVHLSVEVKERT